MARASLAEKAVAKRLRAALRELRTACAEASKMGVYGSVAIGEGFVSFEKLSSSKFEYIQTQGAKL